MRMSVRRHLRPVTRALCSLSSLNVRTMATSSLNSLNVKTMPTTSSLSSLNVRTMASRSSPPGWLQLHGANGSPYTRKVMSALRYKHLAFTYHQLMPGDFMGDWDDKGFGHIKPKVGICR